MPWIVELSPEALEDHRELQKNVAACVERALDAMQHDPFEGDVKALQGSDWKGCFRKRAGDHRIIFTVDRKKQTVLVGAIIRRSEKTYR